MSILDDLLAKIDTRSADRPVRYGTVTDDSPLTVRVDGDVDAVAVSVRLASYTPTIADRVMLVGTGSKFVAIGKVVAA